MPLQFMLTAEAMSRMHRAAAAGGAGKDLATMPVGQIVGSMNSVRSARDVIFEMVEECIATTQRLDDLMREGSRS
jgi:NAD(P)H-dependent flavin oxidoreductase YrpB (nitropropane dioxygenase family)